MRSVSKRGLRKSGGAGPTKGNAEIEVKLRVDDRLRVLRQLRRLKARLVRSRVHEMNTLYDTAGGNLARRAQMLRIRLELPAPRAKGAGKRRKSGGENVTGDKAEVCAWLTFKGPATGAKANEFRAYKVREEHEVRMADPKEMPKILEALGLRPWFRYEKFRTTYELEGINGLKLVLDETPVGVFLELEGERDQIDRAAELLGFSASDYINKSYGALFMEASGARRARGEASRVEPIPSQHLPDMMFRS